MRNTNRYTVWNILLGTFMMACTYYHINFQNNLAEGGFVGLSLLGKYAFNLPPAITMLVLDVPLLAIGCFIKGRRFLIGALLAAASLSGFYELCERFSPFVIDLRNDMITAAVLSGVLTGYGAGLVLRSGGATGGDDLAALWISQLSGLSIGMAFWLLDAAVLLLSLFYLPLSDILYTLLAVSIGGRVITLTYQGFMPEKAVPALVQKLPPVISGKRIPL